jgi:hypothetical protein
MTLGWDRSELPIYGCLTGVELRDESVAILPGITLRRVYVDTFGATMMAFAAPAASNSPHPAPWEAVRGSFTFEGRVQIEVTDAGLLDGLTPAVAVWLVAAVLRLRIPAPIRLAVIRNAPFDPEAASRREIESIAFETAPHQIGIFKAKRSELTQEELAFLREMLPVAARLYHDERFFRAFSVYDQAQWVPTPEIGTVLVWTSMEILFDLTAEREKTKAICKALSDYVAEDRSDRDRAYQVVQDLYQKRGQTVHAGRSMMPQDVAQSFRLASVAFQRTLIDGRLPLPRRDTVH